MKIPIIKENPDDKGYITPEELFENNDKEFQSILKQLEEQNLLNKKSSESLNDLESTINELKKETNFKIEKVEKTLKVKDVVLNEYKGKLKKIEEEDKKNKNEIKIQAKKVLNFEKNINSKIEKLEDSLNNKLKEITETKLVEINKHIIKEAEKCTTDLTTEKINIVASLDIIKKDFSAKLTLLEKKYDENNKLHSIIEKQTTSLNSFKQELKEIKEYFKEELKRVEDKHVVKMDTQPKKIYGLSNVTAPSMIEKTITPGTIRYDKDTDTYRICKKSGWETLKL